MRSKGLTQKRIKEIAEKKNHPTITKALSYISTFATSFATGGASGLIKASAAIGTSAAVSMSCDKIVAHMDTDGCKQKVAQFLEAYTDLAPNEIDFVAEKTIYGTEMLARVGAHYVAGRATGKWVDKKLKQKKDKGGQQAKNDNPQ